MNDIEISVFFIFTLVVRVIGKWLKRVIKQARPIKSDSYGMPSGRGIIVGFTAVYFFLLYPNMNKNTQAIIITASIFATYMKYYLREHTLLQLVVGLICGILLGYTAYGTVILIKK